MKGIYYGVFKLIFFYTHFLANAKLPLAKTRLDSYNPLAKARLDSYSPLAKARLDSYNPLAKARLDSYNPLAKARLDSYNPLVKARLDSYNPLAKARLDPYNPLALAKARLDSYDPLSNARLVPDDPLKVIRTWTINRESGHCTVFASTKPYTSIDPSLFQSIHGAIEDINGNITSIRVRKLQKDDLHMFSGLNTEGLGRSGSWRYEACKCACKEARRDTCGIYNCRRMQDSFNHYCKKYCREEFC